MQGSIQKWGNSLGLRIPAKLATQLKLKSGSGVEVTIEKDCLIICPTNDELDVLLDRILPSNKHDEEFDTKEEGKETW